MSTRSKVFEINDADEPIREIVGKGTILVCTLGQHNDPCALYMRDCAERSYQISGKYTHKSYFNLCKCIQANCR